MGDAAIVIVDLLVKTLDSVALIKEKRLRKHLKEPIAKIGAVLLEARKDLKTLERCMSQVGKLVYEADDIVDEICTAIAVCNRATSALFKVRASFNIAFIRMRTSVKIKQLGKELGGVALDWSVQLGIDSNSQSQVTSVGDVPSTVTFESRPPTPRCARLPTRPRFDFDDIVGRDADKCRIIDQLLNTSRDSHDNSVISVVGIGGIGKTTLAQFVFNDDNVRAHFDFRLWVFVFMGDEYSEERILKDIMEAIGKMRMHLPDNVQELLLLVRKHIEGKLFLLVLDDVWEESLQPEIWGLLKNLLALGARGSKILITTRSNIVAQVMRMGSISFKLETLSEHHCWLLFKTTAFGQHDPPPNLVPIGRQIVQRCRGLPLAIRAIGSVLRGLREEEWQAVLNSVYQPEPMFQNSVMDCLRLSYKNLDFVSRSAFPYCSTFPKYFEFNIPDIVSLWMAQGLLGLDGDRGLVLEDIGHKTFQNLLTRSFFENLTKDDYGTNATCKMHELIHGLAMDMAGTQHSLMHLCATESREATAWVARNLEVDGQMLRTFLRPGILEEVDPMIFICSTLKLEMFKSVRVLDLHGLGIIKLPDSLGNLIHLRYCDLSYNKLVELSNSILKLYNLQTLKLNYCLELKRLPTSMWKLANLRRLEIDECEKLTFMPPAIENLASLRMLSRFVLGRPSSKFQVSSGLKALAKLNHLRGKLHVELSKHWRTFLNEAQQPVLSQKQGLRELCIIWPSARHCKNEPIHYQQLLEGLRPHPDLKMLHIERYRGNDFPSWARMDRLAYALPNLVSIILEGGGECSTLPNFSRLLSLKHLTLRFMNKVQFLDTFAVDQLSSGISFFQSLESLTLHGLYSLKGWGTPKSQADLSQLSFPRLSTLKIWSCPKLDCFPLFPAVEVLDLQNVNVKLLDLPNASPGETMMPSSSRSHETPFCFPKGHPQNLPCLMTLKIKGCPVLPSLPALKESLQTLKKLVVDGADALCSLIGDLQDLSSLEEIEISNCKNLDLSSGGDLAWESLQGLRRLTLTELPKLVTFPDGLGRVPKLNYLCVSACKSLRCLPDWIRNLTSLQHLRLEACPNVITLPDTMKDLGALVKVDIIECPVLIERCKEGGQDRQKIPQARVLCHKSWRYALMSEDNQQRSHKKQDQNVIVNVENPAINVAVTITRAGKQTQYVPARM